MHGPTTVKDDGGGGEGGGGGGGAASGKISRWLPDMRRWLSGGLSGTATASPDAADAEASTVRVSLGDGGAPGGAPPPPLPPPAEAGTEASMVRVRVSSGDGGSTGADGADRHTVACDGSESKHEQRMSRARQKRRAAQAAAAAGSRRARDTLKQAPVRLTRLGSCLSGRRRSSAEGVGQPSGRGSVVGGVDERAGGPGAGSGSGADSAARLRRDVEEAAPESAVQSDAYLSMPSRSIRRGSAVAVSFGAHPAAAPPPPPPAPPRQHRGRQQSVLTSRSGLVARGRQSLEASLRAMGLSGGATTVVTCDGGDAAETGGLGSLQEESYLPMPSRSIRRARSRTMPSGSCPERGSSVRLSLSGAGGGEAAPPPPPPAPDEDTDKGGSSSADHGASSSPANIAALPSPPLPPPSANLDAGYDKRRRGVMRKSIHATHGDI